MKNTRTVMSYLLVKIWKNFTRKDYHEVHLRAKDHLFADSVGRDSG